MVDILLIYIDGPSNISNFRPRAKDYLSTLRSWAPFLFSQLNDNAIACLSRQPVLVSDSEFRRILNKNPGEDITTDWSVNDDCYGNIYAKRSWFRNAPISQRKDVIAHEIGHGYKGCRTFSNLHLVKVNTKKKGDYELILDGPSHLTTESMFYPWMPWY